MRKENRMETGRRTVYLVIRKTTEVQFEQNFIWSDVRCLLDISRRVFRREQPIQNPGGKGVFIMLKK